MFNKKAFTILSVLLIASVILTACGATAAPAATSLPPTAAPPTQVAATQPPPTTAPEPTQPAAGVKRGGILKWTRQALPATLDPVWTDSNYDIWLFQNVYEPLVRVNREGTDVEPAVAESWDISADGLVYTFHLRSGIKFQDGSAVKASDVVWSLDRARDPEAGIWNWTLENVDKVEAVDEATAAVTLKTPSANLLSLLSMFNAAILPQALVEARSADEFFKMPIGTGPFKVAEYVVADHMLFEKNPYYWDLGVDGQPLPYLDGVQVVQVPESSTRVLQAQSGDVDGTDDVPFSQIDTLKADPNVTMELFPSTQSQYGWLNHTKPPLDDVNVRLALNYAVDRQALIDTVLFGYGEIATSFRARNSACWDPNLEGFAYDLAKAKELMAASKYPDGFDGLLVTVASGNAMTRDIGTVLKEMWSQIGINVDLQEMETGMWYAEYDEDQFVVQIGGWTDDVPDALQQTEYMAVSPAGRTGWQNDQVVALAKAAAVELDHTKRCEMYYEIQKIFNQDAVEVLLFNTPYTVLLRNDVHGFNQTTLGWLIWKDTWLDR
jgi:peptide/nickel transport system substrate-binding protein